jgi:capsular polysaccharide biosynthesis protein
MSHGTADTSDAVGVPDRADGDRPVTERGGRNGGISERMWAYDFSGPGESPAADDLASDLTAGPTRHRSIRKALRRRWWLWCTTTVLGLLIGLGLFAEKPPGYQASASVMLAYSSDQNVANASVTDVALAQSHSVAEATLQRLGLRESLASFFGSYTATATADRIIQFTATAPSSDEAVIRATALASEFLQFRTALLENQQRLVSAALNSQLADATQGLAAAIATYQATAQVDTTTTVDGSKVLNVGAPIHRSLRKTVTDPGGGLAAGLALGMGFIIIQTLVSDRPRRRDDVAGALGAPVRLSVGKIRLGPWLRGRFLLAAARRVRVRRIAGYLRSVVPSGTEGVAALAVVPVGDPRAAALSVVSLAESCAQQGLKVVLADLCSQAPAARLLRAKRPGTHEIDVPGVPLTVVVPDRDDLAPAGPLGRGLRRPDSGNPDRAADPLAITCESADLLLTLADLDPALGAEHLPEWATDVVVVVTAGRASWAKIHIAGEMIRLNSLSLVSGVLIGVDKTDESLGTAPGSDADADRSVPHRTAEVRKGALIAF